MKTGRLIKSEMITVRCSPEIKRKNITEAKQYGITPSKLIAMKIADSRKPRELRKREKVKNAVCFTQEVNQIRKAMSQTEIDRDMQQVINNALLEAERIIWEN